MMPRRAAAHSAPQAERGFTMIELVIAITLLAAISAGLLMSMHTALLAMQRTQARMDQDRRATTIQELVYNQLGAAMPVAGVCNGVVAPIFRGNATSLLMVSSYSFKEGARGYPRIVSYRLEQEPRGTMRLVADEFLFSGPASTSRFCVATVGMRPIADRPETLVIASGLASASISYRIMNSLTALGGPWRAAWTLPDLPAAIRIDLTPAAPDPSGMPVVPITVPLHINRQYGELYGNY